MKSFLFSSSLLVMLATIPAHSALAQSSGEQTKPTSIQAIKTVQSETARLIKAELDDVKSMKSVEREFGAPVSALAHRAYGSVGYEPIWTHDGIVSLIDVIGDLFTHGIIVESNDLDYVVNLMHDNAKASTPTEIAENDLEISTVWLRVVTAITGGLGNQSNFAIVKAEAGKPDVAEILLQSATGDSINAIGKLAPDHPEYTDLINGLAEYRAIKTRGGWLAIPEGQAIKPGESSALISALRTRLAVEGYYDDTQTPAYPERFDPELEAALKTFQRRHGLDDDGVLGAQTIQALNESVESKIDRIADTLYRMRHMGDIGPRYIWANIPSYMAEGWDNNQLEIEMKTIVGKTYHQTPVFSDEVEYVVSNPNWYVPISIARRSKIPHMKKDPGYAAKNNFTILDRKTRQPVDAYSVDWSDPNAASKYQFIQGPGEDNALGEMKIIFPNQYSVYLHGTPGKDLFNKSQRAFSSGCIRLENPTAMAEWIADKEQTINRDQIKTAVKQGDHKKFNLDQHIPVHVTYFTVTSNHDGSLNFWRDIYNRVDGIKYVQTYAKPYERSAELRTYANP